jgi:hypothetical protein
MFWKTEWTNRQRNTASVDGADVIVRTRKSTKARTRYNEWSSPNTCSSRISPAKSGPVSRLDPCFVPTIKLTLQTHCGAPEGLNFNVSPSRGQSCDVYLHHAKDADLPHG